MSTEDVYVSALTVTIRRRVVIGREGVGCELCRLPFEIREMMRMQVRIAIPLTALL